MDVARLLRSLQQHPGYQALLDELAAREGDIEKMLLRPGTASENAAEYASKLGEIRGLRAVADLTEQAIARGEAAAVQMQERQNRPAAEEAA
jgi:hypothetical protein